MERLSDREDDCRKEKREEKETSSQRRCEMQRGKGGIINLPAADFHGRINSPSAKFRGFFFRGVPLIGRNLELFSPFIRSKIPSSHRQDGRRSLREDRFNIWRL